MSNSESKSLPEPMVDLLKKNIEAIARFNEAARQLGIPSAFSSDAAARQLAMLTAFPRGASSPGETSTAEPALKEPSIKLAFSLMLDAPPASPYKAPERRVVKLGTAGAVDLGITPLVVLFPMARFRGAMGQPVAHAYLGRDTLFLFEGGLCQLREGIDRYNREGGKFLWLLEGQCAVNLALVTAVEAVELGRKIRIKFEGKEAIWEPKKPEEVGAAVARFAQARGDIPGRKVPAEASPDAPAGAKLDVPTGAKLDVPTGAKRDVPTGAKRR